ncbi:MAG TPA: hypothetical protein VEQ60_21655, partial [Longimicrobium sp.]|nr:hypothetical protein [Longimicrobium sp.]
MLRFTILGVVAERDSGIPLPGLYIKAYDKDLLFDDLLGAATSDARGLFEIITQAEDFREFFEMRPDIYFKVYRGVTLIHTTEHAVRWGAGPVTDFRIEVPGERFHTAVENGLRLSGGDGEPREEFAVGEALTLHAEGLRPAHVYEAAVQLDGRDLLASSFITDREGRLGPGVLWPQMGLYDVQGEEMYTPRQARERWGNRQLDLVLSSQGKEVARQRFSLSAALSQPLVIASDREGRLSNGFEVGTEPLHVTLWNLPFTGAARVYMVPRQHD